MGREIRRVPKGWEHPRKDNGHYQPLRDKDYATEAQRWLDGLLDWEAGGAARQEACKQGSEASYYWEWEGDPPDHCYYRPAWTPEEATCYQVYETVSKGTPVSPVFETLDELVVWLVAQGYSLGAAQAFAKSGWAPSAISMRGHVYKDIEAIGHLTDKA